MEKKDREKSNPSPRPHAPKTPGGQFEYRPDRPGPRDLPAIDRPGDEVEVPEEEVAQEELTEDAIEHGVIRPPKPRRPATTPTPGEEAAPERPPNPAANHKH